MKQKSWLIFFFSCILILLFPFIFSYKEIPIFLISLISLILIVIFFLWILSKQKFFWRLSNKDWITFSTWLDNLGLGLIAGGVTIMLDQNKLVGAIFIILVGGLILISGIFIKDNFIPLKLEN